MTRSQTATVLAVLATFAVAEFPLAGLAAGDEQAEREARRIENELRRDQQVASRNIEARERAQAEALRGQEEAIRRMEATQQRMQADAELRAQQAAEQLRSPAYIPFYPYTIPRTPNTSPTPGVPESPSLSLTAPGAPASVGVMQNDAVSRIDFAPLSDGMKRYLGVQNGVLVVNAGGEAPFSLRNGDVLLAVDGRLPLDGPHAARILRSYQPGERVRLRVQRDSRTIELDSTAP
jgi:hypothetical protein